MDGCLFESPGTWLPLSLPWRTQQESRNLSQEEGSRRNPAMPSLGSQSPELSVVYKPSGGWFFCYSSTDRQRRGESTDSQEARPCPGWRRGGRGWGHVALWSLQM